MTDHEKLEMLLRLQYEQAWVNAILWCSGLVAMLVILVPDWISDWRRKRNKPDKPKQEPQE